MRYIISFTEPHQHFVDIEFIIDNVQQDELMVQLPAWRPGRYELGNFAKNIQKWKVTDEKGNVLISQKVKKDLWKIKTGKAKSIQVKYNYYAAEINAGSTYLDERQLYMNPVNCCLYVPDRLNEPCILELKLPSDYRVACGLQHTDKHTLFAKNYHDLADSPFIASSTLKQHALVLHGVEFNLWFQGECKPDMTKIINDFFIFINEQLLMMKEFPVDVYHFLFQILPYRFYHGVEHLTSTVIALGPSYKLMGNELYHDLLGISSHELFHVWNVKSIRPADMMPYDYSVENYSKLGYVCEGVTTYYGDLLLFRSGVYSELEYFKTIVEHLQKHFDNFGRFHMSVADASFDTWLDGYAQGVPSRRVSIYDEGCLTAFMTDILIRMHTADKNALDDVMRILYRDFAKKEKGYTTADYQSVVESVAGTSLESFFNNHITGTVPYDEQLSQCFDYIGCDFLTIPSKKYHEHHFGFKVLEMGGSTKVTGLYPNSVAAKAGLWIGDEIVAVNDFQLKNDLADWCSYFGKKNVSISISSGGYLKKINLLPGEGYYKNYYIRKSATATERQKKAFNAWSKRRF